MTTESEGQRKAVLRRSRRDRIIGGVSGGLGEFFGLNPWWFRIGFLIASLPGGVPGIALDHRPFGLSPEGPPLAELPDEPSQA